MKRLTLMNRALRAGSVLAALAIAPTLTHAQTVGNGFMFGHPNGSFALHAGFSQPSEGGDVFDFVRSELTLNKNSFVGPSIGGDLGIRLTNRFSLQLNGSYSGRTVKSEMRNWVDNNDLPIEQTSSLQRVPVMAGLRFDLVAPGRSLSKLAWVPNRIVPYVAAGGGYVWYRFLQRGDFVDSKTLDVFHDDLVSSSWTPGGYGAAGVEFAVTPLVSIQTEARYDKASASTSTDFIGFNRIDLSGVGVTLGLSIRY